MTIAEKQAKPGKDREPPDQPVDPECWRAVGKFIHQGLREFERETGINPVHVLLRNGEPVVEAQILVAYEALRPGAIERIMKLASEVQRREHLRPETGGRETG